MNKEYGQERRYFVSFLIGILSFMLLYVPISIFHHQAFTNDKVFVFIPFVVIFLLMPTIHSCLHILPSLFLGSSIRITLKWKFKVFPVFYFCTKSHLSKPLSLFISLAPTLLLTLPGIVASFAYKEFYVYTLILTAANLGLSLKDFIYAGHLMRAPKRSRITNRVSGIDILINQDAQ